MRRFQICSVLNETDDEIKYALTPAPGGPGRDNDSSSNDDRNNGDSDSNDESHDSSGSNNNDDEGNDANNDNGDGQDTSSSEGEDETEDGFEQTNPLREQIRESVSGALSASGIAVP